MGEASLPPLPIHARCTDVTVLPRCSPPYLDPVPLRLEVEQAGNASIQGHATLIAMGMK